mgnify:CR=1 FL=1
MDIGLKISLTGVVVIACVWWYHNTMRGFSKISPRPKTREYVKLGLATAGFFFAVAGLLIWIW